MTYRHLTSKEIFEIDLDFTARLKHSVFGSWLTGPRRGEKEAVLLASLVIRFEPIGESDLLSEVA